MLNVYSNYPKSLIGASMGLAAASTLISGFRIFITKEDIRRNPRCNNAAYNQDLRTLQIQNFGILGINVLSFGLSGVTFIAHTAKASKTVTFCMTTVSTGVCTVANILFICLKKRPVKPERGLGDDGGASNGQNLRDRLELEDEALKTKERDASSEDVNDFNVIVNMTVELIDQVLNSTINTVNDSHKPVDPNIQASLKSYYVQLEEINLQRNLSKFLKTNFEGAFENDNYKNATMGKLSSTIEIEVKSEHIEGEKYKLVIEFKEGIKLKDNNSVINFDDFARQVTERINSRERTTVNYAKDFSHTIWQKAF